MEAMDIQEIIVAVLSANKSRRYEILKKLAINF